MKKITVFILLGWFWGIAFAQSPCNIQEAYSAIFKIEKKTYGDTEYLRESVLEVKEGTCFSELVNANGTYLSYLQKNFSDYSNRDELRAIGDSIALQQVFIQQLKRDATFNATMNRLAEKITDPTHFEPDTLALDEVLNIAVKFFTIKRITEEGYYSAKVCAGINGIKLTEPERKPHIEAFCFSAIITDVITPKFNIYDAFVVEIKKLYKVNLGIDKEERLLRAQGAIFMLMRENETLKELLLFEYEQKKRFLPFVLDLE